MKKKIRYSEETKRIVANEVGTIKEIGKKYNVSDNSIWRWRKKYANRAGATSCHIVQSSPILSFPASVSSLEIQELKRENKMLKKLLAQAWSQAE